MTAWYLHFLGELVWPSFACFGYPDVIDLGEQLLLELMSCVFGTIYSGFGVSGVFAFVHAWLHEVSIEYHVFWCGEPGD